MSFFPTLNQFHGIFPIPFPRILWANPFIGFLFFSILIACVYVLALAVECLIDEDYENE